MFLLRRGCGKKIAEQIDSMRLNTITILGITHKILYFDSPSEVDIVKRESLWGQVDHWTRTIRIYNNGMTDEDILHIILHEILHAIGEILHIEYLAEEENDDDIDLLALALMNVLIENPNLLERTD